MPDRLPELLRQRALLKEHLAWLDREIAAASGRTATPPARPEQAPTVDAPGATRVVATSAAPAAPGATQLQAAAILAHADVAPLPAAAPEASLAEADAIIAEYAVPPDALKSDVKKGCFIYLFAAFALLALGVVVFYFALHHG